MKKIILRLDLNVPINYKEKEILETERIDVVLPEIKKLTNKNFVTILSHLGKGDKKESLKLIESYIRKNLNEKENENLQILENTRWQKGETMKENTKEFKDAAKYFSSFGDEYINDAFSAMHRGHASIVGIPKIFKKEGRKVILGERAKLEIKNLEKSLNLSKNNKNNTLLILGGAKISTKLPLIRKFLEIDAKVFVFGGIANQILKEIENVSIGKSFIEKDFKISTKDKTLFKKAISEKRLVLPIDSILNNKKIEDIKSTKDNNIISDIGPATFSVLKSEIEKSKNIIMNGPVGIYEKGFVSGTEAILKELKNNKFNVLIGGGDTLVLIKKLKIVSKDKLFISTAGGAMLDFLANNGDIPGIKALK